MVYHEPLNVNCRGREGTRDWIFPDPAEGAIRPETLRQMDRDSDIGSGEQHTFLCSPKGDNLSGFRTEGR